MLSGLLVLGLLLAAPSPAADAGCPWQVPGVESTLEVPGVMNVGGIPIRLQVYSSHESVVRLLQSFVTTFSNADYYVPDRQPRLVAQPHLTALNPRTLVAYTLILEPEPGGRLTTVVLGEARLGELKPPAPSPLLPVYSGARNVLQGDFEGARTLAFQVSAKDEQVRAFYREHFTHLGFKEEEPGVFRRQEQEARLSLSPVKGELNVVLFLKTVAELPPLKPTP